MAYGRKPMRGAMRRPARPARSARPRSRGMQSGGMSSLIDRGAQRSGSLGANRGRRLGATRPMASPRRPGALSGGGLSNNRNAGFNRVRMPKRRSASSFGGSDRYKTGTPPSRAELPKGTTRKRKHGSGGY